MAWRPSAGCSRPGARVGIADLNPPSDEDLAGLGAGVVYAKTDITDEAAVTAALDAVEAAHGPLRAVVHCAGRGGDRVRILDKEATRARSRPSPRWSG